MTQAGPFDGVRILSLAEQWPGPLASMILADLGADVILVERPQGGDPTRRFPGHFAALNRNKRSIVLDLKSADGQQIFHDLAATADVLMEGFRPGVMARLNLGPEAMRTAHPALIYVSISSFGHTGPLSARGGHDLMIQGLAGYVSQGADPAPAPLTLADMASAMYATIGIITALYARRGDGAGRHVDVAMLDALLSWRNTALVSHLNGLENAPYPPQDPGYGVYHVGPAQELVTLSIAGEDHQWRELCLHLGLDDIAGLPTAAREQQADALRRRIQAALDGLVLADIEAPLAARGVGIGRVLDAAAIVNNPQVKARGLISAAADAPDQRFVLQPVQFDGWAGRIVRPAPRLGEHSRALLESLGYGAARIEAFLTTAAMV